MSENILKPTMNQYSLTLHDLSKNITSVYFPYVDCDGYRPKLDPRNLVKINRFFQLLQSKQYKLSIRSNTHLISPDPKTPISAECYFPSDLKLVHNLKDGKRTYYMETGCKLDQKIQLFSQDGIIPMITLSTENDYYFTIHIHDKNLYLANLIASDGEATHFTTVIIVDNADGTSTNMTLDRPRDYFVEVHPLMEIFKWVGISGSDFHFTLAKEAY